MDSIVWQLREHAAALRNLANRLTTTPLHQLAGAAGPGTWAGPVADEFVVDLAGHCATVRGAAGGLRNTAGVFDARADAREAELAADAARAAQAREAGRIG